MTQLLDHCANVSREERLDALVKSHVIGLTEDEDDQKSSNDEEADVDVVKQFKLRRQHQKHLSASTSSTTDDPPTADSSDMRSVRLLPNGLLLLTLRVQATHIMTAISASHFRCSAI